MDFIVGDSVLLSTHHIDLKRNSNFKPCFIDLFCGGSKSGSQAYWLHFPVDLKHVHDVVNVFLLKPFHSGGDGQDAPATILVDSKVEYKVDSIVGYWISRGVHWYLVSFAGYDLSGHCG